MPKRKADEVSASGKHIAKVKRVAYSVEEKLKVLDLYAEGLTTAQIVKRLNMPEATCRGIRRNADKIKGYAVQTGDLTKKVAAYTKRDPIITKMEPLLTTYVNYSKENNIPLSGAMIQAKAKELYDYQKLKAARSGDDVSDLPEFVASRGWLNRYIKREGFGSYNLYGEAASADTEAADEFIPQLKKYIEDNGYEPRQVFNVDESAIYYKKIPRRTYMKHADRRYRSATKAVKLRFTIGLGGNAAGYKLKPFVVHKHLNPRCMTGVYRSTLPVHWFATKSAWVNEAMFDQYFIDCLIPELKQYAKDERIEAKFLILLDNARVHGDRLNTMEKNIKVKFLPKNTTALIQPMDQGPIRMCQTNYLKFSMLRLNDKINLTTSTLTQMGKAMGTVPQEYSDNSETEESDSDGEGERPGTAGEKAKARMVQYWKDFNVYDAVLLLGEAWAAVSTRCVIASWKKLAPYLIKNDFEGFDLQQEESKAKVLALRELREAGLREAEENDIDEVLNVNFQLTVDEMVEIQKNRQDEFESARELAAKPAPTRKDFTVEGLDRIVSYIELAKNEIKEQDFNAERAARTMKGLSEQIAFYVRMLHEKRNQMAQPTITSFFTPTCTPTGTPMKERTLSSTVSTPEPTTPKRSPRKTPKKPAALPPTTTTVVNTPGSLPTFSFISPCSVTLTDIMETVPLSPRSFGGFSEEEDE